MAVRLGDTALRESLALEIAGSPDLVWSGDVADVVITDRLRPLEEETGPLVLVADVDPAELSPAVRALLPPDAGARTIMAAMRLVAEGLVVLPDSAVERLSEVAADGPDVEHVTGPALVALTPREQQVLQLLAAGASNKAIARHLDVSVHTAKFHVASLLRKLGASGRLEAVGIGLRTGLLMV